MNLLTRYFLATTIVVAFVFGYFHHIVDESVFDFHRLHIFLFNLCTGGSIILFFSEGADNLSKRVKFYFVISILYALSASLAIYPLTLALSIPLFLCVESARIERFSFFPKQFFDKSPLSEKFLQASMCCLSIAIIAASCVVINNIYLNLVHLERLNLNVFFLGYSFPVSLLAMAIIFSSIKTQYDKVVDSIGLVLFWTITLGVIVFFGFILAELLVPQIIIASALICAVFSMLLLFLHNSEPSSQRHILMSGMWFLFFTGITGLLYILKYQFNVFDLYHEYTLTLHAKISLYGWNMCGIFLAIRWNDSSPISRPKLTILLHWLAIFALAPLGHTNPIAALMAIPLFGFVVFRTLKN